MIVSLSRRRQASHTHPNRTGSDQLSDLVGGPTLSQSESRSALLISPFPFQQPKHTTTGRPTHYDGKPLHPAAASEWHTHTDPTHTMRAKRTTTDTQKRIPRRTAESTGSRQCASTPGCEWRRLTFATATARPLHTQLAVRWTRRAGTPHATPAHWHTGIVPAARADPASARARHGASGQRAQAVARRLCRMHTNHFAAAAPRLVFSPELRAEYGDDAGLMTTGQHPSGP